MKCHKKHNTLLHEDDHKIHNTEGPQASEVLTLATTSKQRPSDVLLATAIINIEAKDGSTHTLKALLDQGSQASFISERAAQRLGLKRTKTNITVTGIHSQYKNSVFSSITMKISPRFKSDFNTMVTAFVLDKLTQFLPEITTNTAQWHHLQQIILADPEYNKQGKIDVILGADVYGEIILDGILKGQENSPLAQQTELGWIVSGKCGTQQGDGNMRSLITTIDLEEIKKFWELEELNEPRELNEEDKKCIEHFEKTVSRDKEGRYIVRLPFRRDMISNPLGDSKKLAISRLLHMERKFRKDKHLEADYKDFMQKYLDMGHMKLCKGRTNQGECFLPHHAVVKQDSKTTKLRVVFDASAKTGSGESLNSTLYTGPQLQADLYDVLLQWRKYKFVFKADVEKMFRQIWVHEEDQAFQKIVWRFSERDPIQEYQLATVTYGTRPAPFLAIKAMQHLATQQKEIYPKGAHIVLNKFYMDDLLSGGHTIEEARLAIYETVKILQGGGFPLRKWSSNHKKVLSDIPKEYLEPESSEIGFTNSIKTLGLHWNPINDNFIFKINMPKSQSEPTKRSILSESARLFDPIGWLAPVVIRAKIIFQELWNLGLEWDDKLPAEVAVKWQEYNRDLPLIETLQIPRWVNHKTKVTPSELHGFCDASEKAYAAVVYLRTYDSAGNVVTHLISSKTKVAPTRKKISLPRLELCGALLLTKLMKKITEAMDIPLTKQYAWTDSEIVLAWLNGNPNKYKTFVANRISKIQNILKKINWYHVRSKENPADCASRGISAGELINHHLWWKGPDWLQNNTTTYKKRHINPTEEEIKKTSFAFTTFLKESFIPEFAERYSSIEKATRILAYCFRFINMARGEKTSGTLTLEEIQKAKILIIRAVQEREFPHETTALSKGNPVNAKSALLCLNPFLDQDGLMRVGGRLKNSDLSYDMKHPVILPYKHHLTNLVIDKAHKETMHGGTNLTLSHTRNKYWILKGYSAVKQKLKDCIICARYNAKVQQQLMGELPKPRLKITRPFTNTGVDYAGPVAIKAARGRGAKTYKGYIAVFICLATKAIHLEAVSDLTAEAFIAAFKRFVGRRGIPHKMYSDNATNFQLASKILEKNQKEFKAKYEEKLLDLLQNYETEWSFIPPAAPHFGGLWEAGVKSMKQHLKRTLGQTALTFEELSTLLAIIEACLNSRPLCPMTDDPSDLSVLTPGHFLIGSSLLAPPGKEPEGSDTNIRSRWKLQEDLHHQIWRKWSTEYLHRLQCRPKWMTKRDSVRVNDLVLIKDEALPPAQWALGRIEEIHAGNDNMTRVVTVRAKDKLLKRPLTKICLLPVREPEERKTSGSKRSIDTAENLEEAKSRSKRAKQQIKINPVTGYSNLIKEKQSKENTKQRRTASKHQKMSNFTLLFILTLLLIPALAEPLQNLVKITPFKNHPGIYFEDLGETNLIASEWNIVTYYGLQNYWQELKGLRNCINEIHNLCNITIISRNYCKEIHAQFERQLIQIEEANKLIHKENQRVTPDLRSRRSPLNIVGKAANYLFGILDEDYAEELTKKLGTLQHNEQHLLQLIKNQTSLIETTTNVMQHRDEHIQTQFKMIQDHIKDIAQQIQQNGNIQEVLQTFNSLTSHTTLVLYNFERVQNSIIDVLTDLHHGRINPLIISPLQLRTQIRFIRENIPSTLSLPDNGKDTDLLLYSLMTASVRVMESNILFKIKLPLLQSEKYQLFHLVPVPTRHEDLFTFIEPETPYLIVNLHRDSYYPLTQMELDKCTHLEADRYLCHQNHPIYNSNSMKARCELNLLKHINHLSSVCNIRTMKPSRIWIQLRSPNAWLYIMEKEHTFNIVCTSTVIPRTLSGEGTLVINPECEIKEKSMTISGHGLYTTHLNTSFIPTLNISHFLASTEIPSPAPPTSGMEQHWQPNNEAYAAIRRKISKIRQEEHLPQELSNHHLHHYIISYLLVAIILFGIGIAIFRHVTGRRKAHATHQSEAPNTTERTWDLTSSQLHI